MRLTLSATDQRQPPLAELQQQAMAGCDAEAGREMNPRAAERLDQRQEEFLGRE